MESDDWCVAVFKSKQDNIRNVLVGFYAYMKDVEGVKNQHFLIRDRADDEAVFSYRVSVEPRLKEVIRSKMAYKLGTLLPEDKFVVDPTVSHPFEKYVAWSPKKKIDELGPKKFAELCDFLTKMSKLVLQMAKKRHFNSNERVEIAHIMSWMLGCTEYGLLSPKGWEIGYYDRIEDKNHSYLKEQFPKS